MKKRILLVGIGHSIMAQSLLALHGLEGKFTVEEEVPTKKLKDEKKSMLMSPSQFVDDIYVEEDKHPFDKFINGNKGKKKWKR